MAVTLGIERLLASHRLTGRRIGFVCNPASVDGQLRHIAHLLLGQPAIVVGALFGPQHGFHSDLQDNMIETPHAHDRARSIPIYSLYSETREPTPAMLDGLDVLVIDLQDVGTRVYTFVYTMANCLRAAARAGLPVIVCDRPNPIGGLVVDGPMLEPGFASFVGMFPIPLQHGMTIGELARLFNDAFGIGADLHVEPMEGWSRGMYFDATGLPWVMPSPNMPTLETALVYPGAVLVEGTTLSEGRGTTRPFECIGAPWINEAALARELQALRLPGVVFRPIRFEPTFQKHAGVSCGGVQIHVTDRAAFPAVLATVAVLVAVKAQDPGRHWWRQPPYEYEYEKMPIDILSGSPVLRERVDAGDAARAIAAEWDPGLARFAAVRQPFLMY
jgi:uncharacterized protein YbbC (DUF1343 family)